MQEGDKAAIDKTVVAAQAAFKLGSTWRKLDASHRGKLIHKFCDMLERDLEYLASLETVDNGTTYADSDSEFDIQVDVLEGCVFMIYILHFHISIKLCNPLC